jgi:hypothetical protein
MLDRPKRARSHRNTQTNSRSASHPKIIQTAVYEVVGLVKKGRLPLGGHQEKSGKRLRSLFFFSAVLPAGSRLYWIEVVHTHGVDPSCCRCSLFLQTRACVIRVL